jgi:hypothetical protein
LFTDHWLLDLALRLKPVSAARTLKECMSTLMPGAVPSEC